MSHPIARERRRMDRNWLAAACAVLLASSSMVSPVRAQILQPLDLPTLNYSATIAIANQFQTLVPANTFGVDSQRKSLTIQNNNTTDPCYINVDGAVPNGTASTTTVTTLNGKVTAIQASIYLTAGGSYGRYMPYLPSGAITGMCTNASGTDSIYVDIQ